MREIQLTQGYVALIDDEDYDMVNFFSWHVMKRKTNIYVGTQACVLNKKNIMITLHWLLIRNVPKGYEIDHIDGNALNNQKSNLRVVTHTQNMKNARKSSGCVTSKYKGVFKPNGVNSYKVLITVDKKVIYLGYYKDELEAAKVYNEAALKYFGEYAKINIL
jgi:hypothetical protein